MPIRAIIFDFGNVIGFFDHRRTVSQLARFTDLPPTDVTRILYNGELEDAYERGLIDTASYLRECRRAARLTCSDAEFLRAYSNIFWRNDEVCQLIPHLKPDYRVVLASNTTPAHYETFANEFADLLQWFDYLGTSFRIGARKPEHAYFARIHEQTHAEPQECLFIDDLPKNVESAREFGWHGIVYQPDGSLFAKLRDAGIVVSKTDVD